MLRHRLPTHTLALKTNVGLAVALLAGAKRLRSRSGFAAAGA
jgi:hypothetical protein